MCRRRETRSPLRIEHRFDGTIASASKFTAWSRRNGWSAPVSSRAENSYDFVRFCAASAVLFSHHFDLAGLPEPPVPGYGEDFGELGVEVFFCLSGFLICRSLQNSTGWVRFVCARILRIFPNLAFVLVVSSTATFLWYGNYDHLWPHIAYVVDNLLLFVRGVTQVIPGVFTDASRPAVNEPLWTLPYELWLYTVLALIFVLGTRWSSVGVVVGALLLGMVWSAAPLVGGFDLGPLHSLDFVRLGSYFLSGAVLAVFWRVIGRHALAIGAVGLVGTFIVRNLLPIDTIFHSLALAGAVIGLGSSKAMAWFSKGGDASYGMYVFAWPVQQFSLLLIGPFWLSMLAAFVTTTAVGYATWHAFEKRAMSYPERLAQILQRGIRRDRLARET
jgi:peptidoglycan/LPS O-acetylase OafA/YrhL